jgi:hypothetical protein
VVKIVGYGDRFSVASGKTIRFMVSTADDRRYRAELLRIRHGDCNPQGPGFKAEPIASPFAGSYQGRRQEIRAGSYVRVPHHECCEQRGGFTLAAMIWPTTPAKGAQGIICKWDEARHAGVRLEVGEDRGLAVTVADGRGGRSTIGTGKPMLARRWYLVAAIYDEPASLMALVQRPLETYAFDDAAEVSATVDIRPAWPKSPLVIAGWALDGEPLGELDGIFLRPMSAAIPQGSHPGLRLLARDPHGARDRRRSLRAAWRGGQPSRPRHEGLELDRRGAVLVAQARALRCYPRPRRRPLGCGLGERPLVDRAGRYEERRLCRPPRDRRAQRRGG